MQSALVLLVADDMQADRIGAALSSFGIIRCADPDQALAQCRSGRVCLAVIADDPPRQNGIAVFASLVAVQPGIAGILLSAAIDSQSLNAALEAGFSGLLELSVNEGQLVRVVNQTLERLRLQEENTRLRTLIPLYGLGEQFFSASTEQEVLDGLLDAVSCQTGASHISIMLYKATEDYLYIAASRGMAPQLVDSIRLQPGEQIAGWVFQKGKPVILNREDQDSTIFAPLLSQPEVVSAISFPLRIRGGIIGVVNISQTATEERFSDADNEMLSIICSQAAVALENVRTLHQLASTTRMRTLFEQYVAPEVAELLIAQNSDLTGLGEVKRVTVLFADIRNFTRLVQRADLSSLRVFLNEFFQMFTGVVFRHRGTVDKFMGDAVLAIFGAPVRLESANCAAAGAACEVRGRFEELRRNWGANSEEFNAVDLGIAVTCGEVFLGNLGSAQRLDYTVIGNEVNIAQRLAAESSSCRIYATEPVEREIRDHFLLDDLGDMQLRGVERSTRVFCIQEERKPAA